MKADEIARLLPWVFQRTNQAGNPLSAILGVIEGLQEPSEEILANVDTYFDPYRAPDRFVPYLAGWVGLDHLLDAGSNDGGPVFATGNGRLRELIAANAHLSRWRGTHQGLLQFLEVATGVEGFAIEENPPDADNRPQPFHLRIQIPETADRYQSLIVRIVESEKPAYVTYELIEAGADTTTEPHADDIAQPSQT